MSSIHDSPANSPAPGCDDGYPEQRHAGAVGYGPEYAKGATTGDKLAGYKEQLKGKVLHKPDLVEHGRELRTGELKKRHLEDDDDNPFGGASTDKPDAPSGATQSPPAQARAGQSFPPDPTHPTEKGAREQAAATAPEGTEKAQRQKTMGNADEVSYID
ncbi:hypothetical protein BC628DRAFT_242570 [Trametes gibbosa]|nr:hypothetical protein BC628DRAFT_242570 [Trametes gibbosa]